MIKKLIKTILERGWRAGSILGVVYYVDENKIGLVVSGIEITFSLCEVIK